MRYRLLPYSFIFALAISFSVQAQHTFSAKVIDHDNQDPLVGVTVYFQSLSKGDITDANGLVKINNIPSGTHQVSISYVGYESIVRSFSFPITGGQMPITFELEHAHEELEVVLVQSTRSSRTIEDSPTRVEFIAGEELAEKGNMKPGDIRMLLNESTGVRTQQTSATSYNSSIRIQGLDGKYTQLIRDGLPLYSGYSGGLSLMQIAPLDLQQVELIKGASSTLYGGGAIAGIVNLISKTPSDEPELSFMLNGTSALGLDASTFYATRNDRFGVTVFGSYNKSTEYDPADIGLTAIPKFDRFTLNPKVFFYFDHTDINVGMHITTEDRLGGSIDYIEGDRSSNLYFERNETQRITSTFDLQHVISERTHLSIKNSFSYFDRSIQIPDYVFEGLQQSSFSEVNVRTRYGSSEWIGGLNLWTENFDQQQGSASYTLDFNEHTFGLFVQNTTPLHSMWTLETGLRYDIHSTYGSFLLPRLSLMVEPSQQLTMRIGGGYGYKVPTLFSEESERRQFQDVKPLDSDALEAERSLGTNIDINYRIPITNDLVLNSNILFFYTRINDPLLLTKSNSEYEFTQPNGSLDTKGVEVNLKWSYKDLKLFVGYTHADVQQHTNGNSQRYPLVAKHRLNNVLMYEKHGEFWIGLEAYYYSPQLLGDGSEGESYWITGLMMEKKMTSTLSLFLNFENFMDTRQTRFDAIYTGSIQNPEFKDIYAPLDGFVINGGVKLSF
ncbi:TonB-dependent receptor [Balneola vulgaris]|uniref:TonB-dependent receptor n=1 Tax=Balneola vulgaris TaxID=287535 RepID=UPI000362B9C3|nr:TonB-dependent receptor [Balneola vulgaris]